MPLNLKTNDGDFSPFLKYNAKAGRFYARPEGGGDEVEVINPRLAFDMANIKTGWLYYEEGSGPEKVWDPTSTQEAPRPAGPRKFKRGFEVMVYGKDEVPGVGILGLREFSSTATNCITAILEMYDEYERNAKENFGRVPFFGCSGVKAIAGKFGTNYEPKFKLIGWVDRNKIPAFDEHRTPTNDRAAPPADDWQAPPPQDLNEYSGDEVPF